LSIEAEGTALPIGGGEGAEVFAGDAADIFFGEFGRVEDEFDGAAFIQGMDFQNAFVVLDGVMGAGAIGGRLGWWGHADGGWWPNSK